MKSVPPNRLALLLTSCICIVLYFGQEVGAQATFSPIPVELSIVGSKPAVIRGEPMHYDVSLVWPRPVEDIIANLTIAYSIHRGSGLTVEEGNFSAIDPDSMGLRNTVKIVIRDDTLGMQRYIVRIENHNASLPQVHVIEGVVTIIPPLVTILFAIVTRDVLLSLYFGVLTGAFIVSNFNPLTAFLRSLDTYILGSIVDDDHSSILIFTWLISGMIACMVKCGGGGGLVLALNKYARTPRSGGLLIACMSMLIFFDDYANTLIVGQTMKPIADQLLISREKLAFLVDGIAAPITSISPVSSWIGFEVSLIEQTIQSLTFEQDVDYDRECYDEPYIIFLNTIQFRFYPIFLLFLQFALVIWGRELGPMLTAERKARCGRLISPNPADELDQQLESLNNNAGLLDKMWPSADTPLRWWNGVVPIFVVVVAVIASLVSTGIDGCNEKQLPLSAQNIFGQSDSTRSLLYASAIGVIAIFLLVVIQRVDSNGKIVLFGCGRKKTLAPLLSLVAMRTTLVEGMGNIMDAVLTLILAWAIGNTFQDCQTGDYISHALRGSLPPQIYPTLTFVMASLLALITGTAWGTMAILFPIVVPAAHEAAPCNINVVYGTIAGILAGAVFGDHCSPISDTTLLASISCQCSLPSHVWTQAPYAAITAVVAILFGTLPCGYEVYDWWGALLVGGLVMCVGIPLLCAKVDGKNLDKLQWLAEKLRGVSRRGLTTMSRLFALLVSLSVVAGTTANTCEMTGAPWVIPAKTMKENLYPAVATGPKSFNVSFHIRHGAGVCEGKLLGNNKMEITISATETCMGTFDDTTCNTINWTSSSTNKNGCFTLSWCRAWTPGCVSPPPPYGQGFSFLSTFGSNMVLQQGPAISAVYGIMVGSPTSVTVTVVDEADGSSYDVNATFNSTHQAVGPEFVGNPITAYQSWKAFLKPTTFGGNYTIKAACVGCTLDGSFSDVNISNVTFGDVWHCSGQSNMWLPVMNSFSQNETLGNISMGKYSNIRVMAGNSASGTSNPWMTASQAAVVPPQQGRTPPVAPLLEFGAAC